MIDFACRQFKLDVIVKCALGLTKADFSVMQHMIEKPDGWHTAEDAAIRLKLDLSTSQRALKKLFDKGVVERRQDNLEGGGYVFSYQAKNRREISSIIIRIVDEWAGNVGEQLKKWK